MAAMRFQRPIVSGLLRLAPLAVASCLCALAPAQCTGSWVSGFGAPGADGRVLHFAVYDDGTGSALYAGGQFTSIGNVSANYIAKWNGSTWSPLGSGLSAPVSAMEMFDDGSGPALYVSGNFGTAGGVPIPWRVARWNGSAWSAAPGQLGVMASALAVFDDGSGPHLYAGGSYAPSGVMKLTGGSWVPVPGYPGVLSATVGALTVIDLGAGPRLYTGGNFNTSAGTFGFFGRWNGSSWEGSSVNGFVNTIVELPSAAGTSVYVGGQFTSASGIPTTGVACVLGPSTGPLGSGISGTVQALATFDDGSGPALYAAGNFTFAGGISALRIARWDGTQWSAVGGGLAACGSGPVGNALATFDSGSGPELFAGGNFVSAGSAAATSIARWSGGNWSAVTSGTPNGVGREIRALKSAALPSGPGLFAGGDLCLAGSVQVSGIARFDGSGWQPLGAGLTNTVFTLESFDDGTGVGLYAGGYAIDSGATVLNGLGRWNGASWAAVGGGLAVVNNPGFVTHVFCLRTFDDGSGPALFVGGFFDHAGGVPVSNIASWNGTSWSTLAGGVPSTAPPFVAPGPQVMEVFDDGSGPALFVGGIFSTAGSQPAQGLAKWDGTSWTSLPTGFSALGPGLNSMAAFDDGSGPVLFVTGSFSTIGGVPAPGFAKWNGQSWAPGIPPPPPATGVTRVAVLDDGSGPALHALVGGPGALRSLQRWDGASWTALGSPFNYSPFGNYALNALTVHDDGSGPAIFAAGAFAFAGGVPASGLAKWATPRPTIDLSQASGPGSGILIADQHLVLGHEYFNIFSTTPCAGPPGFGPYMGLCAPNPSSLLIQFNLSVGSLPFHFSAGANTASFGPFQVPSGLIIDGVCFDYTGAVIGCRSPVARLVVQ